MMWFPKKKKKKKRKGLHSDSNGFFRSKLGDLQKKRSSPKFEHMLISLGLSCDHGSSAGPAEANSLPEALGPPHCPPKVHGPGVIVPPCPHPVGGPAHPFYDWLSATPADQISLFLNWFSLSIRATAYGALRLLLTLLKLQMWTFPPSFSALSTFQVYLLMSL